jgi:glutamate synthase (NADPH/NADH) small chain
MTTVEGVFAAGDVVTGPLTVVHAADAAKKAAEAMIRYMEKQN